MLKLLINNQTYKTNGQKRIFTAIFDNFVDYINLIKNS